MCLGGVSAGQARFAEYKASVVGREIHYILGMAMVCYTTWFLYIGMDNMMVSECSRHAFFLFMKVVNNTVSLPAPRPAGFLTLSLPRIFFVGSGRYSKYFSPRPPYFVAYRSSFPVSTIS
jgi:hypothetical protein